MVFLTLYWLLKHKYLLSLFIRCLAILYDGAVLLLITGLIGLPGLCILSWAFNVGDLGFFCFRCFICFFLMMRLLYCNVFNNFCIYQLGFYEVSEICFRLGRHVLCWNSRLSIILDPDYFEVSVNSFSHVKILYFKTAHINKDDGADWIRAFIILVCSCGILYSTLHTQPNIFNLYLPYINFLSTHNINSTNYTTILFRNCNIISHHVFLC